jgi:response regulator RpfG family c-di-GMP phosphodiesterase
MNGDKILFVDDEPNLLDGVRNQFRKRFEVSTAAGGAEALRILSEDPSPFAVVISDMQMPQMNGAQFLSEARAKWPNTVRMILTGNSGIEDAIKAVNEGNIFRFLTKPCPTELLSKALAAAVEQYHLVTAEQELLEKTVKGCVQVLTDMLALANPLAMSRTMRVRHYVKQIAQKLGLEKIWQLEIAAMLSHVGCVAISADKIKRAEEEGATQRPEDIAMLRNQARIARDLIATIPRLEFVAEMVAHQTDSFKTAQSDSSLDGAVVMGASILKAAGDLDILLLKTKSMEKAMNVMEFKSRSTGEYNPSIIEILRRIEKFEQADEIEQVSAERLEIGMILARNVITHTGQTLLSEGHQLNPLTCIHLRNHVKNGALKDEFFVWKKSNPSAGWKPAYNGHARSLNFTPIL